MAFPDTFFTERLRAERLTSGHLSELRRMHADAAVMAHLGGVQTDVEVQAYLARNLAHWDRYQIGLWILYERTGDEPIGRAVLRHLDVDGSDEVETGYAFYQPFWGRGLATEVTRACLDFGFDHCFLDAIVAVTRPSNLASQRVLVKSGLIYERDFLRDGARHRLYRIRRPAGGAAGEIRA